MAALALEFLILTAARTNEVIKARWEEFDREKALWTVPAERMKAHKEHTVLLSPRARELIRQLAQAKLGPYVFPGLKGRLKRGTSNRRTTNSSLKWLRAS